MQTAFSLPETIALLSRTPSTLNAFLRGLPSRWVTANEGSDSWSAFDIVGHLVIGERTDWMPRAKRILEHGEAIPFDPFDRFAQGKECRGKSLEEGVRTDGWNSDGVRESRRDRGPRCETR